MAVQLKHRKDKERAKHIPKHTEAVYPSLNDYTDIRITERGSQRHFQIRDWKDGSVRLLSKEVMFFMRDSTLEKIENGIIMVLHTPKSCFRA